jgi:hypothetical protein
VQIDFNNAKTKFNKILSEPHPSAQLAVAATELEKAAKKLESASGDASRILGERTDYNSPEAKAARNSLDAAVKELHYAEDQVVKYVWKLDLSKSLFDSSVSPVPGTPPDIARKEKRELDKITQQLEQAEARGNHDEVRRLIALQESTAERENDALHVVLDHILPNENRQETPAYVSWSKEYERLALILNIVRPN